MSLADLGNTLSGLSIDPDFNMGMGIMAASGPSLMPHSLGQSLAAGTQYAQAAREKAMQAQMMGYQLQQAAIMNGILRRATGAQQPAANSNLYAPSTNAGDAPMLASANGTPGTSYAMPGQTTSSPANSDPVSSALQTPGGALQFAMDRPGFFSRVMPAPTDFVKTLQAAGIDPSSPLGRQILQQNIAKQNYITPTRVNGGGGLYDPATGQFRMIPKAIDGTVPVQLPNGQWAASPVVGGQHAIAAASQSQASGKATFAPMTYTDANGVQHTTTQAGFAGGAGAAQPTPDQQVSALAAQASDLVKNGVPQDAAQAWLQNKVRALGIGYQPAAQGNSGAPNVAGPSAGFVAGQQSAATKAQGAPSKQMADSYGTLSNADANYQQSRQAIEEMLGLAHSKGVAGAAVGVLPESFGTRISPDAAKYQKLHATYVALQGKALGSGGTDAARETIDEAVPTYDKPQSAMVAGLNTQLDNLDLAHIKTQFLTPVYQQGNEKAYTQQSAAFDRNITPDMAPILQMSGPTQRQAVAAAIKANPALKPRFEWAYNNGMLQ